MAMGSLSSLATLLALVVAMATPVASEMFTALAEYEKVLLAESQVADDLRRYVEQEKQRLQDILSLADDYQKHSEKALVDSEGFLSNPVNAFLLVKRFTSEWEEKVSTLVRTDAAEAFLRNISGTLQDFPSNEDLAGVSLALIRLQDTYALTPESIANGEMKGKVDSPTLTAADCMEVGKHCYFKEDHYHAIPWFKQALEILETETIKTVDKATLLDFSAFAAYMQGNTRIALNLTQQWLHIQPENERAHANVDHYRNMLTPEELESVDELVMKNEPAMETWRTSKEFLDYQRLCRGEVTQVYKQKHQLKCVYRRHHPAFYINPLKEEILYYDPRIVVYHDLLTDTEIDRIKYHAVPRLHRSVIVKPGGQQIPDFYRVSKSAWIHDIEDSVIARLSAKVGAMANLSLTTAEPLQVLNYGLGGQYEPHYDFAREFELSAFPADGGNREATCICYMSDVHAGGATVFTNLGVKITPEKNACAFWYNLKRNGEGDYYTRHAGCPVLAGTKWVCNKWFHERGQEFTRPCSLEPRA